MRLGDQLHISTSRELLPHVAQVENQHFVKPRGGLWTSSLIEGRSEWVDWVEDEVFGDPFSLEWYILYPDPTARILVIDSLADLTRILKTGWQKSYPTSGVRWPDFEAIAERYDAMHLTSSGQWATRLTYPDSLYGWDCESTLWFHWCFTRFAPVQPKRREVSAGA